MHAVDPPDPAIPFVEINRLWEHSPITFIIPHHRSRDYLGSVHFYTSPPTLRSLTPRGWEFCFSTYSSRDCRLYLKAWSQCRWIQQCRIRRRLHQIPDRCRLKLRSGQQAMQVSNPMACDPTKASRGEHQKLASAAERVKYGATLSSMEHRVRTVGWMKSSVSYQRANARSKDVAIQTSFAVLLIMLRRKWTTNEIDGDESPQQNKSTLHKPSGSFPMSAYPPYEPLQRSTGEHVPHSLCMINAFRLP